MTVYTCTDAHGHWRDYKRRTSPATNLRRRTHRTTTPQESKP